MNTASYFSFINSNANTFYNAGYFHIRLSIEVEEIQI